MSDHLLKRMTAIKTAIGAFKITVKDFNNSLEIPMLVNRCIEFLPNLHKFIKRNAFRKQKVLDAFGQPSCRFTLDWQGKYLA
jgi:hypothetical protein